MTKHFRKPSKTEFAAILMLLYVFISAISVYLATDRWLFASYVVQAFLLGNWYRSILVK